MAASLVSLICGAASTAVCTAAAKAAPGTAGVGGSGGGAEGTASARGIWAEVSGEMVIYSGFIVDLPTKN